MIIKLNLPQKVQTNVKAKCLNMVLPLMNTNHLNGNNLWSKINNQSLVLTCRPRKFKPQVKVMPKKRALYAPDKGNEVILKLLQFLKKSLYQCHIIINVVFSFSCSTKTLHI